MDIIKVVEKLIERVKQAHLDRHKFSQLVRNIKIKQKQSIKNLNLINRLK